MMTTMMMMDNSYDDDDDDDEYDVGCYNGCDDGCYFTVMMMVGIDVLVSIMLTRIIVILQQQ